MDYSKFRELLDSEHLWPCHYAFRFVVPHDQVSLLVSMLNGFEITKKESSKGKYISVVAKKMMNSSDDVIMLYKQVAIVDGIIML